MKTLKSLLYFMVEYNPVCGSSYQAEGLSSSSEERFSMDSIKIYQQARNSGKTLVEKKVRIISLPKHP
ncbi:MAG: hypothetical protein NW226_10745 [Microscillaceae bacterium]|nr:hypothetical protein [Microscillaceae bacterium]